LLEAKEQKKNTLLTFGGAFSNHIAAVAYRTRKGLKTIGIIRGDELEHKESLNSTLLFAQSCGMQLEFISRDYKRKMKNLLSS
jgi:1-aminocyclopropane-1-carboxylate deaminase